MEVCLLQCTLLSCLLPISRVAMNDVFNTIWAIAYSTIIFIGLHELRKATIKYACNKTPIEATYILLFVRHE